MVNLIKPSMPLKSVNLAFGERVILQILCMLFIKLYLLALFTIFHQLLCSGFSK